MKIRFETNLARFKNDFEEMFRAFLGYYTLEEEGCAFYIGCTSVERGYAVVFHAPAFLEGDISFFVDTGLLTAEHQKTSVLKRAVNRRLYCILSEKSGLSLPYGALTGVRPTRLFSDTQKQGLDAFSYFTQDMFVSKQKAQLVAQIVEAQSPYRQVDRDCFDLFVNVPVCPSRCSYCSFPAVELQYAQKHLQAYAESLREEILQAREWMQKNGKTLRCVYVGGGTPTVLSEDDLKNVLAACGGKSLEFTVEAGRPDSITPEKLQIMKEAGVSRISVNPQSFHQKTLETIGRAHSTDDIYRAYHLCREVGFDINMDLIAMLPGEGLEEFRASLHRVLELSPENITVHTLAIKAGSKLKLEQYRQERSDAIASEMTAYAMQTLQELQYRPYYMYRQKYMSGNLENIGYAREGKFCVYNIDMMEETTNIIACGAGGISKKITQDGRKIERFANAKGIDVYLARKDVQNSHKMRFFENNQFTAF